ncbi:MAG: VTT domain-containing protein [Gammaproteobacteria bacterium]|nr:VTT domain-containing protein [Gammaproteobacteria bacterium]
MNKALIRIILLLVVAIGIAAMVLYRDSLSAEALEQWVAEYGSAGGIVFMLLYAVGTVFFFPGSVLTLAGGAMFGPVMGTVYNLTGATLGAGLAFLVARYIASDWVETKSTGHLGQLKKGVEQEGWRFVAFVRLVPLFPFNALNYALGLTRIKLSHYLIASYICMLPGAIAYTYLGYAGREAMSGGEGLMQKILLALALLAVVSFLPRIIGRLREGPKFTTDELKQRLEQADKPLVLDVRVVDEYVGEQGHIAGSMNIPLEELGKRVHELNDFVESPVALVCRTDRRSAKAAMILAKEGFADVHIVVNGMTGWNEKGYPVE